MREFTYSKGLTLLGTMIVLFFIGILAGCDNPTGTNPGSSKATVRNFGVAMKQWEAKMILKQIYEMEQAYQEKHDFYWPNGYTAYANASRPDVFATIGLTIPPYARYTYHITATYTTFMAAAASSVLDSDPTVDVWTINDLGQLIVTSDDAAD
jgi:Tfp pilus assembly protein PilE